MTDVTQILNAIEFGDPSASEQLLPLVYEELWKLAAAKMREEKPGQTLQATGLVHEAYLRLVDVEKAQHWDSRGHFFAAAAEAMRRLLVERARRQKSRKRGGDWVQVQFSDQDLISVGMPDQIVAIDEALEHLAEEEPEGMELVKLVVFGGFSVEEAGRVLEMSRATAYRHWSYARAWLKTHVAGQENYARR
jgi:RNA polymerase sigma factor (TIGR02999 family)